MNITKILDKDEKKDFDIWLTKESLLKIRIAGTALLFIEIIVLLLMKYDLVQYNSFNVIGSMSYVVFALLTQPVIFYWKAANRKIDIWSKLMLYGYLVVIGFFSLIYGFFSSDEFHEMYIYFMVMAVVPIVCTVRIIPWIIYVGIMSVISVVAVLYKDNPNLDKVVTLINLVSFDLIVIVLGIVFLKLKEKDFHKTNELVKANIMLQKSAIMDLMTELYNHAFSYSKLNELINNKDNSINITIAMIDLDNFKKLNDTYGHIMGDYVLTKFALILKECTRATDIVGRYGGEEFIIIFKHTDAEMASQILERIRARVAYETWKEGITVTFSCGIAEHENESAEQLIQIADNELYYIKHHGRDNYRISNKPSHNN